jgi:hypothetical protein
VRRHADAATLAAFREELLSARKAAQVSAHLAACPRCAALEAQLAQVTTLLQHATTPPMPDALTARIQAALTAEAAARTTDAPPLAAAAAGVGTATPGTAGHHGSQDAAGQDRTRDRAGRQKGWRGHGQSWLALRVAAVTAAVAVIAGGGYGVAQLLTGSPASTGAASRNPALSPNIKANSHLPGVSAGGSNAVPSGGSGTGSFAPAGTMAPLVISSGTNYQAPHLAAQASAVLARLTKHPPSSPQAFPRNASAQTQAKFSPDLQACLIHIGNGQRAQLVDLARYQGHRALIVAFPPTSGAQPRVVVVAPGCTGTSAHIITTTTLPSG